MDTHMHKTMVSIVSLEKIGLIRSQEFMPSEARLKFWKNMIILGPKTAILGPQFCRILVLGPHFWWSGGPGPWPPPGSAPAVHINISSSPVPHHFLLQPELQHRSPAQLVTEFVPAFSIN